jgi:molybdenum cofactor synthesis domain-containing protein
VKGAEAYCEAGACAVGRPTAWIVTVGNELLIGRTVNTNAAWLGKKLTFLGFKVERVIVVPDSVDEIAEEVGRALGRARLVVTTGGLGPTYDDVTLEGVARAAGAPLTLNEEALEMVKRFYEEKGMPLTREREKMAWLPRGARPLRNPVGAAPGALLEVGGTLIASLPGVPGEMKAMFESELEPLLRRMAPRLSIVECYAVIVGAPESALAPFIEDASKRHHRAYVKSHPQGHETRGPVVEVRVMASGESEDEARKEALRALEIVVEGAKSLGADIAEKGCG